jgi:hypothetical protein
MATTAIATATKAAPAEAATTSTKAAPATSIITAAACLKKFRHQSSQVNKKNKHPRPHLMKSRLDKST